jgi:HD-GYP domain-containing protein (c-di-GMP phosphodiesterase class II)
VTLPAANPAEPVAILPPPPRTCDSIAASRDLADVMTMRTSMASTAELVRSSHEAFDGTGYPDELKGDEIPLGARIIAVCDAFDAMTSTRAYRAAMAAGDAIAELRRCAGTQFDPDVVDVFCALVEDDDPTLLSPANVITEAVFA